MGDGSTPIPALSVSAVASRLGVAPSTLRTWDRRYGLGPSAHVAGAHRRYSGADISRLMIMRKLTLEGVSPSEAAEVAQEAHIDESTPIPIGGADSATTASTSTVSSPRVARPLSSVQGATPHQSPRSHLRDATDEGERAHRLLRAAHMADESVIMQLLQASFEREGLEQTWARMIEPVVVNLAGTDELVAPGMDPLSLLGNSVMATLRRLSYVIARSAETHGLTGRVMICAAPDQVSTMAAHVLGAAIIQHGTVAKVLTGKLDTESIEEAINEQEPAVVLAFSWEEPDGALLHGMEHVSGDQAVPMLLAGPGWPQETPPGAHRARSFIGAVHEAQSYVSA